MSKMESLPLQPKKSLEDVKHAVSFMKQHDETEYMKFVEFLHSIDHSLQTSPKKRSNPAVLGLSGFGAAVIMLQLKNMGLVGGGPTVWIAILLGGILQLVAGLQEFSTGNNFGYASFSAFGGVWICFGMIPLGAMLKWYTFAMPDMGAILVIFTIFTFIFLYPAANLDLALFVLFFDLFIGFILADIAHFLDPGVGKSIETASCVLFIVAGLLAWYIVAHIIYLDIFQRDVLPVGEAPLKKLFRRRYTVTNAAVEHA